MAVSGIDASGKGYVCGLVAAELGRRGISVALVNIDPWHHPQTVRFGRVDPGVHFYRNAFRWDDFFGRLVQPLTQRRSIQLTERLIEVARDRYYTHTFDFQDIDVLILDGIFLLKRELRDRYDLAWWIECSFETALRRAIACNQEGLPEDQLVADFQNIYFAAQRHHFAEDDPAGSADAVFLNG